MLRLVKYLWEDLYPALLAFGMSAYAIVWGSKHRTRLRLKISVKRSVFGIERLDLGLANATFDSWRHIRRVFTPTEAAAASIIYGLFVGFVIYKRTRHKNFN